MSKKAAAPHPLAQALAEALAEDPDLDEKAKHTILAIADMVLGIADDLAAIRAKLGA